MPVDLDTDDTERELARGLPDFLPTSEDGGNRKLLRPMANQLDDVANNIIAAEKAVQIRRAETLAQLARIGEDIDVPPLQNETLEHYRARLLASYRIVTSKGTPNEVITGTAEMFGIGLDDVEYESPAAGSSENGTASLKVPAKSLSNSELTATEAATYIDDFATAGARISVVQTGTFTYITPTDYNSSNHDATKGYDGLDANGDPKDNGGTYSGLIE